MSIIDTSDAGRQPFHSGDGRWWITFNGEIYNFQELRHELEAEGVALRGRTDTEILLEAIVLWGTDCLLRLDGMFAFAAYDTVSHSLFLARDPFGEKPLYYTMLPGGGLAFASELQALELLPGFDGTVDVDSVAELLSFQYIGAPRSIYSSVRKLLPAHFLEVSPSGEHHIKRYFTYRPGLGGYTDRKRADLVDELEDILARSVKRRLIADVPLGAFLSGGVDSSTVCALVRRKLDLPLQTFSTGFANAPESEHITARTFATLLGTDHHEQVIEPQAAEFLRGIGAILDEPNADSSCLPVYLLSEFARQTVTVALSGDGGDEMFGGYGRYFSTLDDLTARTPYEASDWCPGDSYYGPQILVADEGHLLELLGFLPPEFLRHLSQLRASIDGAGPHRLLGQLRQTDADNYMPGAVLAKVDRMSMRHALEVRTPYLNVELARFAERLPDDVLVAQGRGKLLLRDLAYRYLPRELIDLPKQGFGLPMTDWGRTSLLNVATDLLSGDDCRASPLFGRGGIRRFLDRQRTPGGFVAYQVWAVAMFESWLRHHPAIVPDLTYRRPRFTREVLSDSLAATCLGRNLWAVSEDRSNDPCGDPNWEAVRPTLKARIAELQTEAVAGSPSPNLRLPDWGRSLSDADRTELATLRGATLVFLDENAVYKLDHSEMSKYAALGVARLIFGGRDIPNLIEEVRLQQKSLAKRIFHCAILFLRFRVLIANGERLRRLPWVSRFEVLAGQLCVTPPLATVPDIPDADLADRFMMFEGLRQLPPIPVGADDIREKGSGRYGISNQVVYFAPTNPMILQSRLYWLVERTPWTEPLLQFVRDRHFAADADAAQLLALCVAEKLWIVGPHDKTEPIDSAKALNWYGVSSAVLARILELKEEAGPVLVGSDTVTLPCWGGSIPRGAVTGALSSLRGATVIFVDPQAATKLDYREMTKLSRLGIVRLIFAVPDDPHHTQEIRLQQKSLKERIQHCALLFLRSRAIIANRWRFTLSGIARRYTALAGALCEASGLRSIEVAEDSETAPRYIAFEGLRQLPPIMAVQSDIIWRGGGRCAVSDQRLQFSPTEPMRRYTHPYWLVERTRNTERLLQFVPERPRPIHRHADHSAFDELLGGKKDNGFTLEPGDPIVVFTHALFPGGAERQWVYLARNLKNAGFDVSFVIYCEPIGENGHYLPMLQEAGVPVFIVRGVKAPPNRVLEDPALQYCILGRIFPDVGLLLGTIETFQQLKPKAVIAELDHPNLLATTAAVLAEVPRIVMSFRNYNPSHASFGYYYQNWFHNSYAVLTQSRRVLLSGNSTVTNQDYEDWIGIERGRIIRIPNAIDVDDFPLQSTHYASAMRRQLGIEPDQRVVLGVFRLSWEKSPEIFIEVCCRLIGKYPELRVLIAGVGPLQPELTTVIEERGLTDKILFVGRRSDVNVLMSIADLLLLTSQLEGMPNVVIEAQCMGLPIVATDAGGTREALSPNVTGIVCPIGDIAALYAACARVLDDKGLARRMGQAGRRHVRTEFTPDLITQRFINLIGGQQSAVSTTSNHIPLTVTQQV